MPPKPLRIGEIHPIVKAGNDLSLTCTFLFSVQLPGSLNKEIECMEAVLNMTMERILHLGVA